VKYPNLKFAMEHRRRFAYEVAEALKLDPASFSRRMRGRAEFAPHERARLVELLGFPVDWLFAEITLPPRVSEQGDHAVAISL
jgi:hypothetical protein